MAPGASAVKVVTAAAGRLREARRVEVSVKDRLGPYERNACACSDELETLARNEAPGLGADTVQPLGEPRRWRRQRYAAWRCRR